MVITRNSTDDDLLDLQLASDQQALAPALTALVDDLRAAADRSPGFWQRQQTAIRQRITESAASRGIGPLAWASAAALVGIAGILLSSAPTPPSQPVAAALPADVDQQLLVAVEQAVQSGVPDSLAPASLLAEEMGQAVQTTSQVRHKESSHEN